MSNRATDEVVHRYGVVTQPKNIKALRDMIPRRMWSEMARYLLYGERPGPLLTAILRNDLIGAVRERDDNGPEIVSIVTFLMHNAPARCWGSDEAFNAWKGVE